VVLLSGKDLIGMIDRPLAEGSQRSVSEAAAQLGSFGG